MLLYYASLFQSASLPTTTLALWYPAVLPCRPHPQWDAMGQGGTTVVGTLFFCPF